MLILGLKWLIYISVCRFVLNLTQIELHRPVDDQSEGSKQYMYYNGRSNHRKKKCFTNNIINNTMYCLLIVSKHN